MTIVPVPMVWFHWNLTAFTSRTGTRLQKNRITQHPMFDEKAGVGSCFDGGAQS